MKTAIVVTSIYDCSALLSKYLENISKYGHTTEIYLVPDIKTPKMDLPDDITVLENQNSLLAYFQFPPDEIPWNSDNRRNVGYLMALEEGAEIVISIDDDNWCREEDFVGGHIAGITSGSGGVVHNNSGWFNNCFPHNFCPRGMPYFARKDSDKFVCTLQKPQPIAINAGLWLIDPDVDAMTWLVRNPCIPNPLGNAVLSHDTWCPVNSQNTAVKRETMVAYYFTRMDHPADRYGDIFQGYFALKCAKHLGMTARFGSPVVDHKRNSHNYLRDAQAELPMIVLLEELLPKLMEHKLSGATFSEAYLSLADFIDSQDSEFYRAMARRMRLWVSTCAMIG